MPQATALQSWLTFAVVKSTTFLLVRSHLFPTSNLLTFVLAYRSISCSHVFTFANDSYKKEGEDERGKREKEGEEEERLKFIHDRESVTQCMYRMQS